MTLGNRQGGSGDGQVVLKRSYRRLVGKQHIASILGQHIATDGDDLRSELGRVQGDREYLVNARSSRV